jgi:hypothetical protein
MSEEEDLQRSITVFVSAKESMSLMKIYFLAVLVSLFLFPGFMMLLEIATPPPAEPTIGVLNGMISTLAIVYAMTVFSISKPSVLMHSSRLGILYLDTFFVALAAASLYFVSIGFTTPNTVAFCVRMIFFCFMMGLGNFNFLLYCAMKFSEKAELAEAGKAGQRIRVEYEKRKKREQESAKS